MSCTNINLYDSLRYCQGETVLPGIRRAVYFIPANDIVKWPSLPKMSDQDVTMDSLVTYNGDFMLAADAKWKRLDVLTDDSNISSESQGTKPSKTFLNKATFKLALQDEDVTGFCRMANADNLVYLVQERGGKIRVIGNKEFETDTKPAQESGAKATDAAGTTINVEVSDLSPAPFYAGKIVTDDGEIDASTGDVIE